MGNKNGQSSRIIVENTGKPVNTNPPLDARAKGYTEATVRAIGRARRAQRAAERQKRNRRIMRAALGWTNQAIADAERMHRQSVARIVSAEKRRARELRQWT